MERGQCCRTPLQQGRATQSGARPPSPPPYDAALTADPNCRPQHSPALLPPPTSRHHAAAARRAGGPSEGLHEDLAPKEWREAGEECAPPDGGWPPGTGTTRLLHSDRRRAAPGDQGGTAGNPPPPPRPSPPFPTLRPADDQRPAREAAALQPP